MYDLMVNGVLSPIYINVIKIQGV